MFPLKSSEPYPRRLWWVAAYSSELIDGIIARTILGDRVVLFRDAHGKVAALFGYCPHRSFPFELGKIVAGRIQCGYHGFEFDRGGQCVHVPTQSGIPTNSAVRTYPIVEREGLIWIWTGEPELAHESTVPDAGAIGMGPEWTCVAQDRVTIRGRFMLLIDNLLDLSHGSFIHANTIPGSGAIAMTDAKITETETSLCVHRLGTNLPRNPLSNLMFPQIEGGIDQCFDAEFFTPALIRTAGDFRRPETGERLGTMNVLHAITPESPTSLHYWVMQCRDVERDNAAASDFLAKMGAAIQPEDLIAIEAIERGLQDMDGTQKEVSCRVDTGALKVRHRIEKLMAAESA